MVLLLVSQHTFTSYFGCMVKSDHAPPEWLEVIENLQQELLYLQLQHSQILSTLIIPMELLVEKKVKLWGLEDEMESLC